MQKSALDKAAARAAPQRSENFNRTARRELKFLFGKLTDIIPTNPDCYLMACNGTLCIIDRYRPPVAGSQVLFEQAGKCGWAHVWHNPERLVTDSGRTLAGESLDEVIIIGVAIRQVVAARPSP